MGDLRVHGRWTAWLVLTQAPNLTLPPDVASDITASRIMLEEERGMLLILPYEAKAYTFIDLRTGEMTRGPEMERG